MSQTTYRHQRLDAQYERMTASPDNDRIQRQCLNAIIVDCWALMITPHTWLQKKDQERKATLTQLVEKPAAVVQAAAPVAAAFPCPGCGKPFGSKQALGAHSKFCQNSDCNER